MLEDGADPVRTAPHKASSHFLTWFRPDSAWFLHGRDSPPQTKDTIAKRSEPTAWFQAGSAWLRTVSRCGFRLSSCRLSWPLSGGSPALLLADLGPFLDSVLPQADPGATPPGPGAEDNRGWSATNPPGTSRRISSQVLGAGQGRCISRRYDHFSRKYFCQIPHCQDASMKQRCKLYVLGET